MDIQKIQWKFFLKDPLGVKPEEVFRAFSGWIAESPEVFVDAVDYRHVHDGPLVCLIGFYSDYVLDETDRRRGLLYNRRQPMEGSNEAKVEETLRKALAVCKRLSEDPVVSGSAVFLDSEMEFIINDRAIASNCSEDFETVQTVLKSVLEKVFPGEKFQFKAIEDARMRFGVHIIRSV